MPPEPPRLTFDHLTVTASSLKQGVAYVQDALGISVPAGGAHGLMGTHNHLLRLGEDAFLEIIAADPEAPAPGRARWFNLDRMSSSEPRLATWVVRTSDIRRSLQSAPSDCGEAVEIARDGLHWLMSVPVDGSMPKEGAFPTFIEWPRNTIGASRLPNSGCWLEHLVIEHPDAEAISRTMGVSFSDDRITIIQGATFRMRANIATPFGSRTLL